MYFQLYNQVFQEGLISLTFTREGFHTFALLFLFSFSKVSVWLSLLLYMLEENNQKQKTCLQK